MAQLTCKKCMHQVADLDSNEDQQAQGEAFNMWDAKCADGSTSETCSMPDQDENSTYMWVCYSLVGKADLSFKQNVTEGNNTKVEDENNEVDLYMRGCLNVTKAGGETDEELRGMILAMRGEPDANEEIWNVEYRNEDYKDVKKCSSSDNCNTDKLEPVAGSASLLSSTMILVTMAAAVAYWNC